MERTPGLIEPPSPQLVERLSHLKLASASDLRRCRSRVRRLAHDIPAFDSVWIDALVQIGKLTPFQARVLESSKPDQLKVGPCVLVRQLGNKGQSFVARHRETGEVVALKFVDLPGQSNSPNFITGARRIDSPVIRNEPPNQLVSLLTTQFDSQSTSQHANVVAPHSCIQLDGRLVLVSRFIDGVSMRELLIRRGRLPATVVLAILRQLVDELAKLEERRVRHGEIRLSKIKLAEDGRALLVDSGVRLALRPVLSVPLGMDVDECEGIAPELIGSRREADAQTEMFALGCAMWTLLVGRAPFPSGDPLAKLAMLRTRPIPSVQEWAPETPERLTACIEQL